MPRVLALPLLLLLSVPAEAQLRAQRITTGSTGFSLPLYGTTAPGGSASTMFVVEQGGTVRTINTASPSATPQAFFNINSFSGTGFTSATNGGGNEQGLLGLAFHPNYASNGLFYAYYTSGSGANIRVNVDQFSAPGGVVNTASRTNVLSIAHPSQTNHNGGWIGFKPGDTGPNLYIATGDGGSGNDPPNNSQNTSSLLGKMLRVNVGANGISTPGGYTIPAGNMTVNPNGNLTNPAPPTLTVAPEIFAYGLRNPFRNSFDRGDINGVGRGNLIIGDVGQSTREEINFIASNRVNSTVLNQSPGSQNGINFGWRVREGTVATPGVGSSELRNDSIEPVFDYVRTGTSGQLPFFGASVTGGYVYRGPAFADNSADLNGTYLFTDYISSQVGSFRIDPVTGAMIPGSLINRTNELVNNLPAGQTLSGVATFAEDGSGNLYMMDLSSGDVFRIVPVPEPTLLLPLALAFFAVRRKMRG